MVVVRSHGHADEWTGLTDWWLAEVDDPAYREEVAPLLLEILGPVADRVLLDLGCGDGRMQSLLAARGARRVIGVDVNLDLARIAARAHPVFVDRLPDMGCVRDAAVDGACAVMSLEHFDDLELFFGETARVIRPSGLLAVVINHPVYTAPNSGPVLDPTDGELFWRFGEYLSPGRTREPAGERSVGFFHRPTGMLLTEAAAAGWSLEVLREKGVGSHAARRDPILARHGQVPHLMGIRWRRR